MTQAIIEKTPLFKILADHTRLRIINLLLMARDELCVNEIADAVAISQSAASHQLAKLEANGIVSSHRMGQTICYEIKDIHIRRKMSQIIKLVSN